MFTKEYQEDEFERNQNEADLARFKRKCDDEAAFSTLQAEMIQSHLDDEQLEIDQFLNDGFCYEAAKQAARSEFARGLVGRV